MFFLLVLIEAVLLSVVFMGLIMVSMMAFGLLPWPEPPTLLTKIRSRFDRPCSKEGIPSRSPVRLKLNVAEDISDRYVFSKVKTSTIEQCRRITFYVEIAALCVALIPSTLFLRREILESGAGLMETLPGTFVERILRPWKVGWIILVAGPAVTVLFVTLTWIGESVNRRTKLLSIHFWNFIWALALVVTSFFAGLLLE